MIRAVIVLAFPLAALVGTATPAEAATAQRPVVTAPISEVGALACPGVLCSPFWKVNRDFVLGRVP